MNYLSAEGITSYYKSLPRGTKDLFVRKIAERLEQSTANVFLKIRNQRWSRLETDAINKIIESRR